MSWQLIFTSILSGFTFVVLPIAPVSLWRARTFCNGSFIYRCRSCFGVHQNMGVMCGVRAVTGSVQPWKITGVTALISVGLIQIWMCILILGWGCEAIAAPGVGCAAAHGSVARAICGDLKLSRLNREMRGLYQKALLLGDRRSLAAAQWSWIVERNKTCARKPRAELSACIVQSLDGRIFELKNLAEPGYAASENSPAQSLPRTAPQSNADCANAVGVVDRAVCSDPNLRHWEDRLGKLYKQALDDPSVRMVLAGDQQRWIGDRTGSCGALSSAQMMDCVLRMTKRRIEQLVQLINSRDDAQDGASKIEKILAGQTAVPPGLDADTIDRESARADQSELIVGDTRNCIRKKVGEAGGNAGSDETRIVAVMAAACFDDFAKRLSKLELGALAKPSFEMLVHEELSASK
jgi:uncharacterized protein